MHGYARNERDESIMIDYGIDSARIWLEGRGSESLARINMRSGEILATVSGLRSLGDSRQAIMAALARIHGAGASVLDLSTGRRSDHAGAEMLDHALARIRGERVMPPGKAVAMQLKSAVARVGNRMPERHALAIWRDPCLTTGEAIARMPGWSARTAYVRLGKRNLPTGRLGFRALPPEKK